MFQNLDLFAMSAAMARHAGQQQAVIARNIANADTPGFKARHLADFTPSADAALRGNRAGHFTLAHAETPDSRDGGTLSPNGNSVSLEQEIFAAVDAQRSHSNALAIYRHAMTVIRTAVRGG